MNLKDITPVKHKCCGCGSVCPAVLKTADDKIYIIVGKRVFAEGYEDLTCRIGPGEAAVEISAELLEEALKAKEQA